MAKAKAKEKTAMVFNSDEEKYEYAKTLAESAKCLLRDKENKTVNKLMPLVYKIYDMEKEYAESKAALSQDCNDPYYKEWLERI